MGAGSSSGLSSCWGFLRAGVQVCRLTSGQGDGCPIPGQVNTSWPSPLLSAESCRNRRWSIRAVDRDQAGETDI